MRRSAWTLAGILSALLATEASAQEGPVERPMERTIERTAKGPPGRDIRVGVYVNVQPDCTSGPLPAIRLVGEPANGKVTVKRANMNATNYKQCLALQVPAFVAFYRSNAGFSGTDVITLEIKFPNRRSETQKITVTVESIKGEKI